MKKKEYTVNKDENEFSGNKIKNNLHFTEKLRRGMYPSSSRSKPVITIIINNKNKMNNDGNRKGFTFSNNLSFSAARTLS